MIRSKKKGIGKRALSVSLAAAMLLTSNVSAWAWFEVEPKPEVFESEAPETAAPVDGNAILNATDASFDVPTLAALQTALAGFAWYDAPAKMAAALTAAQAVKIAVTGATLGANASVGIVDTAGATVNASTGVVTLDPGRTIQMWSAGMEYTADDIGKIVVAKLTIPEDENPVYIAAKSSNAITAVDASTAQIKDWSIVINGKTFTKNGADVNIPVASAYNLESITLTLGDDSVVTIENALDAAAAGQITVSTISTDLDSTDTTITFNNTYKGITGTLTLKTFKKVNKDLSSVLTLADGTLTYDPADTAGSAGLLAQAKKLVNAGNLIEGVDYEVAISTKMDSQVDLIAAPECGAEVFIRVTGKSGSDYQDYNPLVKAVKISAKDLGSLYLDEERLNSFVYGTNFIADNITAGLTSTPGKAFLKYYDASDTSYFYPLGASTNTKLTVEYPADVKAGEAVTIKILPAQGEKNFIGKFEKTFTPKTTSLPINVGDLNTAIGSATFIYDGKSHAVNNLIKGDIGTITRAEYTLTCVEEPGGSIKDAGDYTIVMNITSGPYAGNTLTATTKLTVSKANLNVFAYGEGVTTNPIIWTSGITTANSDIPPAVAGATDLTKVAAPVLTFNGATLVEGVDYTQGKVYVSGASAVAGNAIKMKLDVPTNAKCNFTGSVTCTIGKLQPRPLPELPEIPAQSYADVQKAIAATTPATALTNIKVTNADGTEGKYLAVMKDTDINGNSVDIDSANYALRFSALPESGEGTVTMTIIGKGSYTGTVEKTIAVTKKEVNARFMYKANPAVGFVDTLPDAAYKNALATGREGITLKTHIDAGNLVVRNEGGENVTANCVITYKDNRAAGTATIEATGKTGYDIHAISTFEILPQRKVDADVTPAQGTFNGYGDLYYTGDAINPLTVKNVKLTITDEGYQLKEGTDYEVSIKNNVDAGLTGDKTPTITITGIGNYVFVQTPVTGGPPMFQTPAKTNTGVTRTFTIRKTPITKENITVNNVPYAGGLEVTPDIKVINPYSGKELVKDKDYKVTLTNAVNTGIATAKIELADGCTNYTISPIEVKFEVTKKALADCTASVVDGKVVIKNGEITVPETEYDVTENEDGTFTVTAKADGNYTGTITVSAESEVEAPAATQVKVVTKDTSSVTLAWDKVEGAEGYTIWYHSERDSQNSRKVIANGDTTTWTQKGLAPGTKYFYTVRAWVRDAEGKYVFGEETSYVRGTTKPFAAKIAKVTATNGKIKVTLADKAAGAEKYSMCYSKDSSFSKFAVGVRTSYTSRTFTKAVAKGTYYVRVKSYRELGGTSKIYGEWSNTMKVVVK